MQADMFNLYPSAGPVNAMRNYNYTAGIENVKSRFGSYEIKFANRKVGPPEISRKHIARTYLYFDDAYKRFNMSKSQKQLMTAWN